MICHAELLIKQHIQQQHKDEELKELEKEALKGKMKIVGGQLQEVKSSSSSSSFDYNNFEIDGSHLLGQNLDPFENKDLFSEETC